MERAIEEHIVWGHSKKASDKAMLTRCRKKSQGQSLTIFSVANLGLDKVLMDRPDPFLEAECKIIKYEKKITVGYMALQIGGKIKGVYMKQHNALSFGHRLASLFVASAAMRSLSGATVLLQSGYATARPIAAVEYRRRGVLTKSLYLSEEVSGAKTVETFWCEDLMPLKGVQGYQKRRAFLWRLARMLNSLHKQKIYHNDLKASNVLVLDRSTPTQKVFSLIDLQGLRKCFYVSKRRRIRNLAQLNRTLGIVLTKNAEAVFSRSLRRLLPLQSNEQKKRNKEHFCGDEPTDRKREIAELDP